MDNIHMHMNVALIRFAAADLKKNKKNNKKNFLSRATPLTHQTVVSPACTSYEPLD